MPYINSFKEVIRKMLGHADIGIREISAKALVSLIPQNLYLQEAFKVINAIKLIGESKAINFCNSLHGSLQFIKQLISHYLKLPSFTVEDINAFLQSFESIKFILNYPEPLLHVVFYQIVKMLFGLKGNHHKINVCK